MSTQQFRQIGYLDRSEDLRKNWWNKKCMKLAGQQKPFIFQIDWDMKKNSTLDTQVLIYCKVTRGQNTNTKTLTL